MATENFYSKLKMLTTNILPIVFLTATVYKCFRYAGINSLGFGLSILMSLVFSYFVIRQVVMVNKYGWNWANKLADRQHP